MKTYEEALSKFDNFKISELKKLLIKWSSNQSGATIINNMHKEHFISADRMWEILNTLLINVKGRITTIEKKYQDTCYRHVLNGGPVKSKPTIVGRIVSKEDFISQLWYKNPLLFGDFNRLESVVDDLLFRNFLNPDFSDALMTPYAAWVTWSLDPLNTDPFDFAQVDLSSKFIRSCLGIDPNGPSSDSIFLLLVYDTNTLDLFRPTIADAGLNTLFEPPDEDVDQCGFTKPYNPKKIKFIQVPQPRPEGVHESTSLVFLNIPVRLIK